MIFSSRITRIDDATSVVALGGDVDLHSAHELEQRLEEASASGARRIVADLSATTFFDSTALGVLVAARKRLQATGRELVLVSSDMNGTKVLQVTGLDRILHVYPTLDAALADGQAEGK
jgi:anti-sigma B factor antagonist